jgi:flagellar biosynthesis/type III secretory pathway chaperone
MPDPTPIAPRIRDLIQVAGKLLTLMREETEAMRALKPARIAELAAEKSRLVDAYNTLARSFRKDPETLTALNGALRDELKETLERFEETASENERALEAARDANERVLKAIVDAVQAQRPQPAGYGRPGAKPVSARSAAGLSLALDRRF